MTNNTETEPRLQQLIVGCLGIKGDHILYDLDDLPIQFMILVDEQAELGSDNFTKEKYQHNSRLYSTNVCEHRLQENYIQLDIITKGESITTHTYTMSL